MTVTVRLFARARDLAGADSLALDLPEGSTVADLRRELRRRVPELAGLLSRCAVAVGDDFAGDDRVIQPGEEAALLPPVSGG